MGEEQNLAKGRKPCCELKLTRWEVVFGFNGNALLYLDIVYAFENCQSMTHA